MKVFHVIGLLTILLSTKIHGQYENYSISESEIQTIHLSLDCIYKSDFDCAENIINCLEGDIPDYPGVHLLKVYYYLWKYKPLKETSPMFSEFIKSAEMTLEKCDERLAANEADLEAIFYSLSVHAILARLYVDMGTNWKAIKEAQKSYQYLKNGIDYIDKFPEFNLHSGIYNFYRVSYPEDNPFVKPFLWFFMPGNKEAGLKMLKTGAEQGLFTKAECLTYLFLIYLRYESMPDMSIQYIRKLNNMYPNNENFISMLIENLIYLNQFHDLEPLIASIENSEQNYYKYVATIYKGLYFELHKKNYSEAKKLYYEAMELGESNNVCNPHAESYCFLGLGRIYLNQGKEDKAKTYLKKAIKVSEYRLIEGEAKELLAQL